MMATIFEPLLQVLIDAQTEIIMFLVAFLAHSVIFKKYKISGGHTAAPAGKAKIVATKPAAQKSSQQGATKSPRAAEPVATEDSSDASGATVPLVRALRELIQEEASCDTLTREIQLELKALPAGATTQVLACALEALGRATTSELLGAIRTVVRARSLKMGARLGELVLRGYLGLRLLRDFRETLRELEADCGDAPVSAGVHVLALRAALATPDLEESYKRLKDVAPGWKTTSPSAPQKGVLQHFARLASDRNSLPTLIRKLEECNLIEGWTLEIILVECARARDTATLLQVEGIARSRGVELTVAAYCALLRGASTHEGAVRTFTEAANRGLATDEFLVAAAGRASEANDTSLANSVLQMLPASPSNELAAAVVMLGVQGPLAGSNPDQAVLRLYEKHLANNDVLADAKTGKLVAEAALRCRRKDIFERLLIASPDDTQHVPRRVALLRSLSKERRLEAARAVVRSSHDRGASLIGALVEGALNSNDQAGAWGLVEVMLKAEMKPSHNVCSGFLKALTPGARYGEVDKIVGLLQHVEGGMDEGLLSAFCEAAIKAQQGDILQRQLRVWRGTNGVQIQGAHAIASVIRAYGYIKNPDGIWATWQEMHAGKIIPTRITLGCMVEALATNGEVDAAYEVIQEALNNPTMRHLVNAVIYCSVLKGFSHQKRFDRVWAMYQEMLQEKLVFSIVTYNTLIDACARSCEMKRVPQLLEAMARQRIEPNVITYSAVLKGYCQESRLDKAFEVLADMRTSKRFMPDEVTYNTILDGCARHGMYDRGLQVLEEMQQAGVPPSNFTLSVLVKLLTRSRQPDKAFELCEELCLKYNLKPNVHVYANLVQACTSNGDVKRGLGVLERMLSERIRPDARTYSLLMRACLLAGEAEQAAGLLRAGAGLEGPHPRIAHFGHNLLQPKGGLPSDLVAEIIEGIGGRGNEEHLAVSLIRDLRRLPGRLDPKLSMRFASRAVN